MAIRMNSFQISHRRRIRMGRDVLWLVIVPPLFLRLTIAAIAANIGLGFEMQVAVDKAIDFVQGAIHHSYSLGKGHGPLNHLYRQRNLPFTPYSLDLAI